MKIILFTGIILVILISVISFSSCVKKDETEIRNQKTDTALIDEFADSIVNDKSEPVHDSTINNDLTEKPAVKDSTKKQTDRKIIVYYFHATMRCTACINIENYTEEVVNSKFRKEIKEKKVYYKSVNFETSADEHITEKFNLTSSSVVFALYEGRKRISSKILEDTWDLEKDKEQFSNYIETELRQYLKKLKEV